ncbi:MAG: hypothetical protein NVSMB14_02660 [Isosphaeraceae bacterium]
MSAPSASNPTWYRPNTLRRMLDGLRYRGGINQWWWLIHRLTGIGILTFLVIHIIDTFLVVYKPDWYDHTVGVYGGVFMGGYYWPLRWGFRLSELGLIAAVLFHAINGTRIIILDFWSRGNANRGFLLNVVGVIFLLIMIPVAAVVFSPLLKTSNHWKMPIDEVAPPAAVGK